MCSVPICVRSRPLASSWARTTTRRAPSVNLSNIAGVRRRPAPPTTPRARAPSPRAGPRSERDMPGRRLLPAADDLLHPLPRRVEADAERLQDPRRDPVAFADEAQHDVLGADVVVIEQPGFFLRQDDDPPRPVGEPLE